MTFAEVVSIARRCRFPTGVDARGEDEWCGADTGSSRLSWCPEHRARVFLPEECAPSRLRLERLAAVETRRDARMPGADPQPGWSSDKERNT